MVLLIHYSYKTFGSKNKRLGRKMKIIPVGTLAEQLLLWGIYILAVFYYIANNNLLLKLITLMCILHSLRGVRLFENVTIYFATVKLDAHFCYLRYSFQHIMNNFWKIIKIQTRWRELFVIL